jgi:2-octaprenyl-6-methoxyphenol hydroxylase
MQTFDVVIVGGGLVGTSFACALGNQPCRVALIDQKAVLPLQKNDAAKAIALSWPSIVCLKNLNVWPAISSYLSPIFKVHISKKNHFGSIDLSSTAAGLPFLGGVIDAGILNGALLERVKTLPNISLFQPDEIETMQKSGASWTLRLKSQTALSASLVVAADGADSPLRKAQGIRHQKYDYQQTAVVAEIELLHEQAGIAFEHFLEIGAIALLPSGKNQLKSIWVMSAEEANSLKNTSDAEYLEKLQAQIGSRLQHLQKIGRRFLYPLSSSIAESLYQHRFVLIGNAANTLHPIAAQGFNLGLRDAAFLAENIADALQEKEDIGEMSVLQTYAKTRTDDHHETREFLNVLTDLSRVHQWGILACAGIPSLKKWVVERNLGRNCLLPKLCRGVALS